LEEPEPDELAEPEPEVVPALPDDELPAFELVAVLVDEPGRASATAPAASTLAAATVAVVAVTRLLARRRAATASRIRVFMS
jgi:hypothetical protein